jgi:hypothetical protein
MTMFTYDGMFTERPDGSILGLLGRVPRRCPGCGRMVSLVVNRNGKTVCVDCDERNEKQEAAKP